MLNKITFLIIYLVVFPTIGKADKPTDSVYLEGHKSNTALILAHGKGKHPTWLVVDPLRKAINEKLNYHTLSLQMPIGHDFWEDYAEDFPKAYTIIEEGIRFLREEKGVKSVYLMGHSMGSRMVSAYIAKHPNHTISGLIIAGCRNNGAHPLSCDDNMRNIKIPVLDIWGNASGKDYDAAADRTHLMSDQYQQVSISGGDHRFRNHEDEFVSAVASWLRKQAP